MNQWSSPLRFAFLLLKRKVTSHDFSAPSYKRDLDLSSGQNLETDGIIFSHSFSDMIKPTIKTFEDACEFVFKHKVCTVFGSKNSPYPSLWDNTDLPETKPEGGGWAPRVTAVWTWKTEIPQTFPDEIFYGKVPGGDAVLMQMEYLRDVHYPKHHQLVTSLDALSCAIYELIRIEPMFTGQLRKHAIAETGCTKSRFNTALKKLQITLNIVRSNDPSLTHDFWLPFSEVHLDILSQSKVR